MATSIIAMPAAASGWPSASTDERVSTATEGVALGPPNDGGNGPPGEGGNGPPGHDRGSGSAQVAVPDLSENTTIESILAATERLDSLEFEDEKPAAANESVAAINASLQEFRLLNRTDSREAYGHLAEAQRALGDLAEAVGAAERPVVLNVSDALYDATNASARLAVADAGRVVTSSEDEFRNPGQRQKAESALGNALDALERADDAADRTDGQADRAVAIGHLENAWKHAGRALDTVEDNTAPALTLSQGQAFERNETVLVPLEAALFDVRPFAYDEAVVTVEGVEDDPGPISLRAGESAGGVATGTTLIDVGPDAENATVTVSATASHDADRTVETTSEIVVDEAEIVPDLPDPDAYAEVTVENESSGVRVDVGGDGLHESHIDVRDVTPDGEDTYRAGPMVRIENRTAFDEATVSIPVDEAALDREGNLSIVTWEPESDQPWTAVETEVDRDAGVLRADVEHFSFFSVFWIDNWEDETSATLNLTAEYDGNVTGPGNGSFEKIDATFVIDESGSMSGSPISYARTAGKRFVGALTEDERAALVSFDSYASLRRGLTTDHDAVNASIDGLSGNGGTDTAAGLRTGLNHLEANGWENRSSVMILLADGQSNSNSKAVAEDAAEAGVEISTVGLGNGIDENELRMIAGETGGDFYHVQSPEDLPDAFDRVAENTTGVDLPDTDGDSIPDLVEEMNLSMPSGSSDVVGEPLNLDPSARDTSGDGILDNETVDISYRVYEEDNATMLTASVTNAAHHPARVDTTGDGVTDAEQTEGWEIAYTNTREDSLAVLSDLDGADDIGELNGVDAYFETPRVYANPLLDDTNGDGLTDREEVLELGTDPEALDTTGDGVLDADAEDPTLFDVSSPEITVTYAYFDDPDAGVSVSIGWDGVDLDAELDTTGTYEAQFVAEDPAGLAEARIVQDGTVEDTVSLSGTRDVETLSFETGTLATFADIFKGTSVTVQADDRHEIVDGIGTAEAEAIEVGGVFNQVSQELRAAGYSHAQIEEGLGVLEGMTTGAGETLGGILAVYNDPRVLVEAIEAVPDVVKNFDEVIEALPASIEEQQKLNNPHEEGDRYYADFRQGWYQGYFFWFVVEAAVPTGQAGKAIKSSERVQSTVDSLSTPQIRRAAELLERGGHTAKAPVRYSREQLSRGVAASIGLTRDAGQQVLSRVRTTGSQFRVAKILDRNDVDGGELAALDAGVREAVGTTVVRNGDGGARLLRSTVCNSPCESVIRSVYQYTKVPDGLDNREAQKLLTSYSKADDVSVGPGKNGAGEVQSKLNALDDADVEGVRRSMGSVSGGARGYRGLAGEVDVADRVTKSGVDGSDVEMQLDIPAEDVPDGLMKQSSEIDVKVESEVVIDGKVFDSPAIESKNYNPEGLDPFIAEGDVDGWAEKLATQAGAGEDTLVLVTTQEFTDVYGDLLENIPQMVHTKLEDAGVDADPTIEITTYDNIGG